MAEKLTPKPPVTLTAPEESPPVPGAAPPPPPPLAGLHPLAGLGGAAVVGYTPGGCAQHALALLYAESTALVYSFRLSTGDVTWICNELIKKLTEK